MKLAIFLIGVGLAVKCKPRHYTSVGTIQKHADDPRSYEGLVLDNQLKVLLVSDPHADQAAASLVVSTGAGDDPIASQGMAHLIEHLVLVGGVAFPEENPFALHVELNGGEKNAFVLYNQTSYMFTVRPQALDGALHRFSELFLQSNFTVQACLNEVHAIQSEYELRRFDFGQKLYNVLSRVAIPTHPFAKFINGNSDTLLKGADVGLELHAQVMQHYTQHYSANRMQLVVVSPLPLDELRRMVVPRFRQIPNRSLVATGAGSPFGPEQLPVEIHVNPNSHASLMSVQFVLPGPQVISQHTLDYITYFLKRGDVNAAFKQQSPAWIISGIAATVQESNSAFSLLQITFNPSPATRQEAYAAIRDLFAYLDAFRRDAVNKERYVAYLKTINGAGNAHLRLSSMDLATGMSSFIHYGVPMVDVALRLAPPETIVEREVRHALEFLSPENMQLINVTNKLQSTTFESRYHSNYTLQPFDRDALVSFSQPSHLNLPTTVYPQTPSTPSPPEATITDFEESGFRMRHIKDLASDMGTLRLTITSQNFTQTDTDVMNMAILAEIVNFKLQQPISQLAPPMVLTIAKTHNALVIDLRVPNIGADLPVVLTAIRESQISQAVFDQYKANYAASVAPQSTEWPVQQAVTSNTQALDWTNFDLAAQKAALRGIHLQAYEDWRHTFLSCGRLDALLIDAGEQAPVVQAIRDFQAETKQCNIRHAQLKHLAIAGDNFFRRTAPDQINNAISFYLDLHSDDNIDREALARMTQKLIKNDFQAAVRARDHLTYASNADLIRRAGGGGILLALQGRSDPAHMEARINIFLQEFVEKIEAMSSHVLQEHFQTVTNSFRPQNDGVSDAFVLHWNSFQGIVADPTHGIILKGPTNPLDQLLVEALRGITKSSLVSFLKESLPRGAPLRKKLSVHVVLPSHDVTQSNPAEIAACGSFIPDLRQWQNAAIAEAR